MLKDASVIVTRGSKGVGRNIAHSFAAEGCRVAIADIDEDRLRATLAELREIAPAALAVPADVRDESQVGALVDQVVREFGRLDVLVDKAGIVPHFGWGNFRWAAVKDMELEFWSRVPNTKLRGTFLGTKHAMRQMVPQGSVLNVRGGGGGVGAASYVVSKDAIVDFSRWQRLRCATPASSLRRSIGAAIATEDAPEEARQRMPGPRTNRQPVRPYGGGRTGAGGKLLTRKDGQLVGEDWPLPPTMR
jgi:NAD(P)-dependent dehydrogenase (short-subunit alcohol dehydrogenase family)